MKTYSELEKECGLTFEKSGPYFHVWTIEDHPIIFQGKKDFIAGMNILAICSRLVPEVKIITFQLMTNHIHLTLAGPEEAARRLFELFKRYLARYLAAGKRQGVLSSFVLSLRELKDLNDLRNVITYNNRNGYIVHPEHTPFTYPWGANAYFFNPQAQIRYTESMQYLSKATRRSFIHSHDADRVSRIVTLNGYACPMDFCSIRFGEKIFRCASHYFREISRNIESQKNIAKEIGERIFYTDDELFGIVLSISEEKYGKLKPTLLPPSVKTELATLLHYDYNASNKQISRMLRLDPRAVDALLPHNN